MDQSVDVAEGEQLPDEVLTRRARLGDRDAFTVLIVRHGPGLYRFVRRLVHNSADADDCTQEVIISAWRAITSFRQEATFRTWLYVLARRQVLKTVGASTATADRPGAAAPARAGDHHGAAVSDDATTQGPAGAPGSTAAPSAAGGASESATQDSRVLASPAPGSRPPAVGPITSGVPGRTSSYSSADSAGRRPVVSLETVGGDIRDGHSGPEAENIEEGLLAALGGALALLPERQRSVWLLREVEGLSYSEIGIVVNEPISTVRGLLERARTTVAAAMQTWR
ncbi:RNA polymerase sigma factor [Kineococcus rhizosphaerae]|uniref:RNA polymerase sigma factor n=1 Tax=Kineococcus rhizosphaerae TaxID=559628 RepID=UPI001FE2AA7A|nr:sigma-70 family RNA polymerase sigma factor [Kineococcus rhizosphaerae]